MPVGASITMTWGAGLGFLVRKAELSDIDFLVTELTEFAKFYDSKYLIGCADTEYGRSLLANLINKHVFLVSEFNSILTGFICGLIAPHYFNPNFMTLTELLWWVKPEYRHTRAGAMLLNNYIEIGREFDWCVMTLEDKSPIKPESLLKRGFKFKEQSYILEREF